MTKRRPPRLFVHLGALTISRLFLNTGLRMIYPFLPAFSRGLNMPVHSVERLVSLRGFAALLSPFFGPVSERIGRRTTVALSMILFSLGCALFVLWPGFGIFGVTLTAIALAKVIYDPAMQAYIGDSVPYRHRGKALAVTELSWAAAFLLGVPAISLVLRQAGLRGPFIWLAALGLGSAFLLWRTLPKDGGGTRQATNLSKTWAVIRSEPVIWAAGAFTFLIMGANELILIVYGDWMEVSFGLSLTGLGLATGVIGGAEIIGEILTGFSVDQWGKRRVIVFTGILTGVLYAAINFTSTGLTSALVTLFVLFFFFEMTVVGAVPLMTELVPSARSVVMSVVLASGGLGRAIGALMGPTVWSAGGFRLLGMVSATSMVLAVLVLVCWIREGESEGLEHRHDG